MFQSISKWILKRLLQGQKAKTEQVFLSWDKVNRMAIIISQNEQINRSAIDQWLSETKKFVEVFYVETKSKSATYADWHCFTKKDCNLFNLPNKRALTRIVDHSFDLVINTANEKDFFSAALLAQIKAPFKCAASSENQSANLIVQRKNIGNLLGNLQDTRRYLEMIKMA